jgi:hypothetical protein
MKYSNRLLQQEYVAFMYVFFACHMSMNKLLLPRSVEKLKMQVETSLIWLEFLMNR